MIVPLLRSGAAKDTVYGIITKKKLLHFKRGGTHRAEGIKLQKSKSKKLLRFLKRRCHEVTEEIIKQTTKPE